MSEQEWTLHDWVKNPFTVYQKMRQLGPLHWNDEYHGWLVVDYNLARALLRDSRLSSDITESLKRTTFPARSREKVEPILDLYRSWLIFSDPPYHTALRKLLNPYFNQDILNKMAPRIKKHTEDLLSRCDGQWDVMAQFARLLPSLVMADFMGLSYDDVFPFIEWDAQLLEFTEAVLRSPDITKAALSALDNEKRCLNNAMNHAKPGTFIAEVSQALIQEGLCTKETVWQLLSMILVTGTETTKNLLGSGLFALLSHPDQYQLLQVQPELLDSTIEECLRYYSPVQSIFRLATADIEMPNVAIEKGHYVRIILGAINRDPSSFDNPEQFDIARQSNKHLAFGAGIHFCLGRMLARLTAQVAFPVVLKKFPQLKLLTQEPEWLGGTTFRGLESFFVSETL